MASNVIYSLPYKYLTWELCASTFVNFLGKNIDFMNLESSFKLKELNMSRSSKNIFSFFFSKVHVFALQCKSESSLIEFYLIINPQSTKQLYVGTDDQMPSALVELPKNIDTSLLFRSEAWY